MQDYYNEGRSWCGPQVRLCAGQTTDCSCMCVAFVPGEGARLITAGRNNIRLWRFKVRYHLSEPSIQERTIATTRQ